MNLPVQVTFHKVDHSDALEAVIREKAAELDQFFDRITSCRVVVNAPHKRHRQGNLIEIRIDVTVPGHELVIGRDPGDRYAHEDPYVAVRDAFDAMRRQLEDHARRVRGDVKERATTE